MNMTDIIAQSWGPISNDIFHLIMQDLELSVFDPPLSYSFESWNQQLQVLKCLKLP